MFCFVFQDCPSDLLDLAEVMTSIISPDRSVITISEGEEPYEFWSALGGQGEYTKGNVPDRPIRTPKLFHCYVPYSNKLKVEEIPHFEQQVRVNSHFN